MELLSRYSGISALIIYGIILYIILHFSKRKNKDKEIKEDKPENIRYEKLDLNDEDAVVACLIAAIDCREQYHKNVEIVNVRRIG